MGLAVAPIAAASPVISLMISPERIVKISAKLVRVAPI